MEENISEKTGTTGTASKQTKTLEKGLNGFVTLFSTFFKIGAFTLGGGYAMIPLIESEVVDKHSWISKEEFLDLVAVAQSCPGVFAINISTFIGYKLRRHRGALCAAMGTGLPSFLIKKNKGLKYGLMGVAVVALIAVPTFNMAKTANINLTNCWIPVVSALLIWGMHVNPIFIIIAAGFGGFIYGKFLQDDNVNKKI